MVFYLGFRFNFVIFYDFMHKNTFNIPLKKKYLAFPRARGRGF